ncbi:hypothetical protein [Noviherbaspirillum sedimenti]|uniref:Uncharacterized protein n=1 Tax=Noviherbaspirillum sedimenti TaxID=2320865 RepID=A0A3A3G2T2_9BURK|nr:hypothetical protein [Noviherbaspirillum sedimenti]RJG02777.1 hypothetical protein D3878_15300 [Noviherbaspirillum sedimenti]
MDFREHLQRQLGFLERSCESYDAGYRDEAIRIATIIRVLIHNTKASTSLLQHLNATTINLFSTTSEPSPQTLFFVGLGMMRMSSDGKNDYFPQLGDGPPISTFVPVPKWWEQVVMVFGGHRISRRDIVLAAANKDGGAHVDLKLTPQYEALAQDGSVGAFIYETQGKMNEAPIEDAHLVSLRQLGYEVLHSPELQALAKGI